VDTVRALCELFAQVDVDGNKMMDWEEFTGFCIEAGIALGKFKQPPKWLMHEHGQFSARTPQSLRISKIVSIPALKRVVRAVQGASMKAWGMYDRCVWV
jgi:hypothetical protein